MTAELDELYWKHGAGVWYSARDDDDDENWRVSPGAVVLVLITVVGVHLTYTRRPEHVASEYNVCARQEQLGVPVTPVPWF